MKPILAAAVVLSLSCPPLLANEDGLIVRSATVYADARRGASRIGRVEAGTRVAIFGRKGGWQEIFAEQEALVGWVRTYEVRALDGAAAVVEVTPAPDQRGFLSGLATFSRKASRFFGGAGSGASNRTATIGVRGLSEAEIKAAKPDRAEFERMRRYASDAARLAQFRQAGQLKARKVGHIKPRPDNERDARKRRDE